MGGKDDKGGQVPQYRFSFFVAEFCPDVRLQGRREIRKVVRTDD
jgi:hypothetical protein